MKLKCEVKSKLIKKLLIGKFGIWNFGFFIKRECSNANISPHKCIFKSIDFKSVSCVSEQKVVGAWVVVVPGAVHIRNSGDEVHIEFFVMPIREIFVIQFTTQYFLVLSGYRIKSYTQFKLIFPFGINRTWHNANRVKFSVEAGI